MYFKITNSTESHHGFQYSDGLNVLINSIIIWILPFVKEDYILPMVRIFLNYSIYLREVILPTNNPDFRIIKDPQDDKWWANMIILGKRYDLYSIDTLKYHIDNSANIHAENDSVQNLSKINS